MRYPALVLLLASTAACTTGSVPEDLGEPATVCEAAEKPEAFSGRRLRISGTLVAVPPHATRMLDPACPGESIALLVPNAFSKRKNGKPLWAALHGGEMPGTFGRHVTATLVGIFRARPDGWPTGELLVEHVVDVTSEDSNEEELPGPGGNPGQ